jgi:general secretion pathway protein F
MAHLLAGRVSVLDAIQLSGESITNEHLQQKLTSACDLIRQGESLGRALSAVDVFPKLVVQMVAVGEKSAHLAGAMEEISKLYTRRMRESIRKTLSVLEPAVIAFMGIVVGFIIISLLTAIISVNDIPL